MSSCPIGSGNPGGKGNGTINPALAPAGTSSPKSKQSPPNSAAPSSASPHPPSDGSHQSWGDSSPISANSGTSFLSEASLSTFNESIRQRNAAFSLSPRTESESDFASDEVRTPHQSFSFELDKCSPPEVKTVSLGSTESRRHFICEQCATLAANMSSKRIVEDLLPALIRIFDTDESCALLVVKILPEVVSAMDVRTTNFMVCFLGLLMQLCCSAEAASAIDEVTRSIRKIITQLDDEVILETILPFIVAMRVSFWSTPRAIATGVLGVLAVRPAVVRGSGVPVMEWFNWFIDSSGSSSVPVRLAAVASLHQWIAVAKVHQLRTAEMPLPLVHQFLTDDLSDMVRYHLVRETLSMAKLLGRTATSKYLQSTYLSACKDASWRVRYFAAANLGEMCKLVLYADDLSKVVTALSEDEEPEIRAAVAGQLDRLEHYVSAATIEKICAPVALRLAADPIVVVRSSAVQHLHPLVQLTKEETASTVCKVVVQLMQDASLRVQLSAIRSLESIITALVTPPASSPPDSRRTSDGGRDVKGHDQSSGSRSTPSDDQRRRVDLLSSMFVRHLQNISNSGNWRLRDAVARVVPIFAAAMNLNQFTPLAELLRTLLQDPVCHVRVQAVAALGAVGTFYGCEWAANMATQLLMKDFCAKSKASYTSRVVAVRCMDRLLPIVSHMGKQDMRRQHVVHLTSEFLRSHTSDPVSNVRLALAQSLPSWKDWCSATHDEQVQYNNSVRTLQGDSVTDVRDAAFAATTFHLSGSH